MCLCATYPHLRILILILIIYYVHRFCDVAENDIAVTIVCLYTVSKAHVILVT